LSSVRQFFHDRYKALEVSDHPLLYLFLEITRKCNLACLHCGSDCRAENGTPVLTPESWLSIIDYISERFSKDLMFVITGGEPLTYPHLERIAEKIKANKRTWGMVTNGFGLDRKRLAALESAGLASATISLDGNRESHTHLRNHPHAYERAVNAIALLGESGIPFKDVVTCVYPKNLASLSSVAEILLDCRIPYWRLFRIFPHGRARSHPELFLSHEENGRLLEWIMENRPKYREAGLTVNLSCEGWFPYSLDRKLRSEPFFCRAGINIASILADGTVTGCANNGPAFFEGNIVQDDFARLWKKGFGKFRERSWMRKGLCSACPHFPHCQGGSVHLWNRAADSAEFCYMRAASASASIPSLPSGSSPRPR
jgi:radical SAM protein with 4Fe4S-binding SPASM domain